MLATCLFLLLFLFSIFLLAADSNSCSPHVLLQDVEVGVSGSPPHSGQASTHLQSVMAGANAQLGWHLVVYQAVSRGRPARTYAVDIRRVSALLRKARPVQAGASCSRAA
ncbi:hypothetical protein IQ07DRAFT_212620 [Pyrenochaeta sp. DS3sAY3a]|nr:hypothetical protein IQ07DRAFT_212620 [Pyrenochaeta sp. DS3sAY3a]